MITKNIIMHPDGPFTVDLKGAPHFGQVSALLDTVSPHSLHLINAIPPPFYKLSKSIREMYQDKTRSYAGYTLTYC